VPGGEGREVGLDGGDLGAREDGADAGAGVEGARLDALGGDDALAATAVQSVIHGRVSTGLSKYCLNLETKKRQRSGRSTQALPSRWPTVKRLVVGL